MKRIAGGWGGDCDMFERKLELVSEAFVVCPLSETPENERLISDFSAGNNALGLEDFLKNHAQRFENSGENRTYLVKDSVTGELACYFTLRSGLIPVPNNRVDGYLTTFSAIELAYFAVNEHYRKSKGTPLKIGFYVFDTFILPIVRFAAQIVGARFLYVYALPRPKLISYYAREMGFRRLPDNLSEFLYARVKPDSDDGCIFMFQPLFPDAS